MYIYADESGHSGRHIFNDPLFYLQGAIISEVDTEPILSEVAEKYIAELGLTRLHANEMSLHDIENIAASFLSLLSNIKWVFHITAIEKPYLAVIKFVDSLFDSYENKGARWLWYNHEFFRHTLCTLFDDMLFEEDKKIFWEAYLSDDFTGIASVVKIALQRINQIRIDKRLYQVATDGLDFALKHPEEITLLASRTKKSYKGHTPNMVAFSNLIQAVHKFCKENKVAPKVFIHDSQSEFGPTMKEYHALFGRARLEQNASGLGFKSDEVEYDFGKFSLSSSKQLASLQAVDLLLWLYQKQERIKSIGLSNKLLDASDPFYISRISSEMITRGWLYKLSNHEFSEDQILYGEEMVAEMEKVHFGKLRQFEEETK
ncbi:MAG: DUF3800 domain-containing protein [Thermodesulfobacteriota bacterium]|nr:DUF3800 domain-containing protein [Thermodesulfobacteriota bacterium]